MTSQEKNKKIKKITFSFGKNWVDYVKNFLDKEKLDVAKESFKKYLPIEEYKDKTLIDVGCGSGIFSFNALRLGAQKVISFDIDKYAIEATKIVKKKFYFLLPQNSQWEIFEGNILDKNLVNKLKEQGDIVYSWGVLHHTGKMWQAISNALQLVKPGGIFIVAIYNRAPSSNFWLRVKKIYNCVPKFLKLIMVYTVFTYIILRRIGSYLKATVFLKKRPFELKELFERERGMSIFYDVVDWLGGYPYEYASFEEVKEFIENLGFTLVKAPTKLPSVPKTLFNRFSFSYTGNNEFVFRKNETN